MGSAGIVVVLAVGEPLQLVGGVLRRRVPDRALITSESVTGFDEGMDAVQERTVGHASDGHEHVVAGEQVIGGQAAVKGIAGVNCGLSFAVVLRPKSALIRAAEALDWRRRKHPLPTATHAHPRVNVAVPARRSHGRRRVAMRHQLNFGTQLVSQLDDRALMPIAVLPCPVRLAPPRLDDHRTIAEWPAARTLTKPDTTRPSGTITNESARAVQCMR